MQRDQGNIMMVNKALVHKGFTPLVQMFSDVSKITIFQSPHVFTGKSDDECFKIAGKGAHTRAKPNRNRGFSIFSKQTFGKRISVFALNPDAPPGSLLLGMNLSFVWKVTMPASAWVMSTFAAGCDTISKC